MKSLRRQISGSDLTQSKMGGRSVHRQCWAAVMGDDAEDCENPGRSPPVPEPYWAAGRAPLGGDVLELDVSQS